MNTELQKEKMAKELIPWKLPCSITDAKKWENSFKHEIMYTFQASARQGAWKYTYHLADLSGHSTRWPHEKDPAWSQISSFSLTSKWNIPWLPAICSAILGSSWNLKTEMNSS